MYAALAERNPTARDTFIVPAVKPKVTTDVVDDVAAASASVADVTAVPDATLAPGNAKFLATVTLTQDDGDRQVETHWYVMKTSPQVGRVSAASMKVPVGTFPAIRRTVRQGTYSQAPRACALLCTTPAIDVSPRRVQQ